HGNLHPVIPTNLHSVIPTKVGIQFFEFQSFPINCLSIECLDSRLRGNDGGAVSVRVIPTKVGIQDAKSQETVLPDKFPHRQT
ncbi:TPA: hypothetical protein ACFPSQ_002182, partial [Neisseria meningitidis]